MGQNNLFTFNNYFAIDYMLGTILFVYCLLFINTFYLYKLDASRNNILLNSQNNDITVGSEPLNTQSAENCKGFSETIRQLPDSKFWNWFAGVIDGDGNFDIRTLNNKRVLKQIRIKLHNRDVRILTRIQDYLHMGKIRADKNKPYSMYIVSTKETMMYIVNNINGLIRLKVPGFKEACNLYNINYIEPNYNIGLYDPYFAGLVDTDGSIVFNYAGNRIECNLEFQYNEYSSKLNFDNTILNCKPAVLIRKKSSKSGSSKDFSSISFKFQNVNNMLFIYDYFMHNRLFCDMLIRIQYYLHILWDFLASVCTDNILSQVPLNIQSAGNEQVNTFTLVVSSETIRQSPRIKYSQFLNLFVKRRFYVTYCAERNKLRSYSTLNNSSNKKAKTSSPTYFKWVKSKDPYSPNGIVTNFHIKYNYPELANPHITYELIKSILGGTLDGFNKVMNKNIFKQLKELADSIPIVFKNLPLQDKELVRFTFNVGPTSQITLNNRISIRSGVYIWNHAGTGDTYVGSTVMLAYRIRSHYIAKAKSEILQDRPIDLAIKNYGLGQFRLKLYILTPEIIALIFPEELVSDIISIKEYKIRMGIVVKVLEQIFILRYNPNLNELKIAGSIVGIDRSERRKTTYLFDQKTLQLIYIANSRVHLNEILQVDKIVWSRGLYFSRFLVRDSDELLQAGYTKNLISEESLVKLVQEAKLLQYTEGNRGVAARPVEVKMVGTDKWIEFHSQSEAVRYIQAEYPKVSVFALAKAIKSGKPYLGKYYVINKR
uniref:Homing endonuclease LAGLIDADG domain-containing protein n=1 Tax=Orbilia brochopaga TaxID=3140254 RepID=A0A481ZM12_9PEZI|nr:hypothetical protein [Drechslerella brochopaga]QBL02563.1 hypothetical protein [Drechslerella brochopaga]